MVSGGDTVFEIDRCSSFSVVDSSVVGAPMPAADGPCDIVSVSDFAEATLSALLASLEWSTAAC